ncbi:beta-galactosidase [Candidatus Atribacteria bacterium RBG_19FT_COMBO_35_14]|uniref:Beta-galactosidase n=1 Tax=Candidatus Sediminicultor quintus TaxID=1797291 RepID=A0A1F5A579_9BACT|nr:MAG: beta-galactosidase [Candidatus Atribacteria bacterium RBG_19FT_COMBO_35_14]
MRYRKVLNFNTDWYFLNKDLENAKNIYPGDNKLVRVNLPHSNKIVPHHYFEEKDYQFISWYYREFYVKKYKGKRVIIEFDGVMSVADVYVNGKYVDGHKGGYTSFSFDITDYINFNEENVIAVKVDSTRRIDIPPEGGVVDYMLFGGIYRNVRLVIVENIHISWSFIEVIEANKKSAIIHPKFELINLYNEDKKAIIITKLMDEDNKEVTTKETALIIKTGKNIIKQEQISFLKPELWHPNHPYLYNIYAQVKIGNRICDDSNTKIGMRKLKFKDDGKFYINGESFKLRGLNRHQMFPYLGGAMPDRGQRKDAEILKYGLGLNFVRSSHYPASPSFLDRCDEIGLLVLEEIPGWQYIGDEEWKILAKKNVEEMIIRDRNHASIFLWGVRINESKDDHGFYLDTNRIAHSLDSSRQTCGVRNFQESEFLEDVFTCNDFEYNLEGKLKFPQNIPYMITEYMGHMYPTRSYDSVERIIKHAVYHAKIQNCQYGMHNLAGASGWCAFDYNTHADFGSGDRICYHGVCDIFRLPKFAAYFYKSQMDPEIEKVVFIARYLIPSFNEDYGDEIIVFSNCDEIDLYAGEKYINSAKPDRINYSNLPHPPFIFKNCSWWEWGASNIASLKAIGKINGKEVVQHEIFPFGRPDKLVLKPDYTELIADGADCVRVVIELQDKNSQILHLSHHPVFFEIAGPGKLIAENPFSLEAGKGAVFIQSGREFGEISLKAQVDGLPPIEIIINNMAMQEEIVPVNGNI